MKTNHPLRTAILSCLLLAISHLPIGAQPTNFTYQGQLTESGVPADGIYDFQFVIYNVPTITSPGASALSTDEAMDVPVTNGLFTAEIGFEAWFLNGEQRWLEVQVRTNDSGAYTGLTPWTEITPTPYAVRALTLSTNALEGGYGGVVSFTNPLNKFFGDGSGLTDVTLDGLSSSDFWQLGGNMGTTAGADFIGTTDDEPLELKVNNERVLQILHGTLGPTIVGGYSGNSVGSDSPGSIIGGGGVVGAENTIGTNANHSTISGGAGNEIQSSSWQATIAGGARHDIGDASAYSTVSGGWDNNIGSNSWDASIGGGSLNDIGVDADASRIGGGRSNDIGANSTNSTIGGGYDNNISDNSAYATIAGGGLNDIGVNSIYSAIGGGVNNNISSNSWYATISGGQINDIGVNSDFSAIGGGWNNEIADNSGLATIAGGGFNDIGVDSDHSSVGSGYNNDIADNSWDATIAGGRDNNIGVDSDRSAIGGGWDNNISSNAHFAVIPGGGYNDVGAGAWYAFAAGRQAKANHVGAFVWGDSQDANVLSSTQDQVTFRAQNGLRLTEDAGGSKTINIGDQYRDNALLAWGKISSDGTLNADFGVTSVTHHGNGDYEIFLTDTAANIHSLVPVAIAEIDVAPASASAARIVSINQDSSNPNRFRVYINNGNYALVDNDFVFMVTAR